MERKKHYADPELEIVLFDVYGKAADIITTSGGGEPSTEGGGSMDDAWDT